MSRPSQPGFHAVEPRTQDPLLDGIGPKARLVYWQLVSGCDRALPFAVLRRVAVLAAECELSAEDTEAALLALEARQLVAREGRLIYLPALLHQHSTAPINPPQAKYHGRNMALLPDCELRRRMDVEYRRHLAAVGKPAMLGEYLAALGEQRPALALLPCERAPQMRLPIDPPPALRVVGTEDDMSPQHEFLAWLGLGDDDMAESSPRSGAPPHLPSGEHRPPGDEHGKPTPGGGNVAADERPTDDRRGWSADRPSMGAAAGAGGSSGREFGSVPRGRSAGAIDAPHAAGAVPAALPPGDGRPLAAWRAMAARAGARIGIGLKLAPNAGLSELGISPHLESLFVATALPLLAGGVTVADFETLGDYIAAGQIKYVGRRPVYRVVCEELVDQLNNAKCWQQQTAAPAPDQLNPFAAECLRQLELRRAKKAQVSRGK